jgi:hypothetical protein
MREVIVAPVRRTAQFAAMLIVAVSSAAGAETIVVTMDQAKLTGVPPRTATLVVGNPLIADVTVQAGGNVMVVTGKGYGVTNVIALDPTGRKLNEKLVRVQGPAESVVVYRGTTRESYICRPDCERRITLGDSPDFFKETLEETSARNIRAMSGQAPPPGGR